MKITRILMIIFLIFILFYSIYANSYISSIKPYFKENFKNYNNSLTFENTEKWGKDELEILNTLLPEHQVIMENIKIKPPPINNSNQTKVEINDILEKQKIVTQEQILEMKKELYIYSIIQRFNVNEHEYHVIQNIINDDLNPIIIELKSKYNRVRPYILDKRIKPLITKPEHPSYPSGHATQCYFIAYLMSNKYPHNTKKYFYEADKIAINREYAGFHYESDTQFGKYIASVVSNYFINHGNPLITH